MVKALKFSLVLLGTWVGYILICGAIYVYLAIKVFRGVPGGRRLAGHLDLPNTSVLIVAFAICGVAAFFTAHRLVNRKGPTGPKDKPQRFRPR